jgi:ectoine hydroxylase-related dioxygenase (phytanoyl-CoA dioxygenase family)
MPSQVMADVSEPHPDEKLLIAPKGTVVVFNSHTWHGGTRNRTNKPRPAMHSYFTRRDLPQQTDQRKWISAETCARLSPAARWVLDID